MHRNRPVMRLLHHAAPKTASGLRLLFLFLFGAVMACAVSAAAPARGDKPAGAQAQQADPSQFVGSEVCATCHEETAKKFGDNPHSKIAEMHGKSGATCESCHGAGKAHVDGGGDTTKIFNPSKATAKDVDATCLKCHAASHPNFERSPHAKAGVGCTSCHSVHKSEEKAELLKASQPKLCFQCHNDVKPQFDMPFHHKVNEGLVKCNDCHDAHGTFERANLKSTADMNAVCTKCHTETRGPFVFEHAAVKAEGCVGCHTPHGSQNARLLNMPNINGLCNQCHSPVANSTVHGLDAGSASQTPCVNCHTMIHGSNVSQAFIR